MRHSGGKKELFEAVLSSYAQMSLSFIENRIRNSPSVKAAMRTYFQGIIDGVGGNNPDLACTDHFSYWTTVGTAGCYRASWSSKFVQGRECSGSVTS